MERMITRPDDPRLGEVIQSWPGDLSALQPGRAVLLGFPQDEGVRRNHGRPGAAEAPNEIRRWLYRLTPWDGETGANLSDLPPLDIGNIRLAGDLESTQARLGSVIAEILRRGAIPVVLGGGHETAYGHYLGYVTADRPVGVINLDAHLDVRPISDGQGHSGSAFRQALEHPTQPLPGNRYVCLGALPSAVSRQHWQYVQDRGGTVHWNTGPRRSLYEPFQREIDRLSKGNCQVYVTVDADVVRASDAPGVSAPNAVGLPGADVIACVFAAGCSPYVSSFDLVEINPRYDRDHQSARWAALAIWHFLVGLSVRQRSAQ